MASPTCLPRSGTRNRMANSRSGFWPAIAGEFLGTFVLVFFGVGVVNAAVVTGAQVGLWQVAVVWAIGVSLGIYCSAALSGAHINPAMTAVAVVYDRFPLDARARICRGAGRGRDGRLARALRHVRGSDPRVRAPARAVARRPGQRAQRHGVRRVLPQPGGVRHRRGCLAHRRSERRVPGRDGRHGDARLARGGGDAPSQHRPARRLRRRRC